MKLKTAAAMAEKPIYLRMIHKKLYLRPDIEVVGFEDEVQLLVGPNNRNASPSASALDKAHDGMGG